MYIFAHNRIFAAITLPRRKKDVELQLLYSNDLVRHKSFTCMTQIIHSEKTRLVGLTREEESRAEEAIFLLLECRFSATRSYDAASKGVTLMELIFTNKSWGEKYAYPLLPRGLVYFPSLLLRYIHILPIDVLDFTSMLCRCVEHKLVESLDILLQHDDVHIDDIYGVDMNLKLMTSKYEIDDALYQKCCTSKYQARDLQYEGKYRGDEYPYTLSECGHDGYFGYRDVTHGLIYASPHMIGNMLIEIMDDSPSPYLFRCTIEAILDFCHIPFEKESESKLWNNKRPILRIRDITLGLVETRGFDLLTENTRFREYFANYALL